MKNTRHNPVQNFARSGATAANALFEKMPEKVQQKVAEFVKNGYRLCLSLEVGSGDPVIKLELVNDLEKRQPLIECKASAPQRH